MWPALREPRFRRLLVGRSVSSFGDSALYLTLGIWAKDLTGSNAAAGAVFLAQALPSVLAPAAGHLADRVRSRRTLLLVTDTGLGLAVLSLLAVESSEQLWLIYGFSAVYGLGSELGRAAQAGLVKDLLPAPDLVSANAAMLTVGQGVRIASPLVGAGIYAGLGGGALAILDAVTFGAAVVTTATIGVAESPVERDGTPLRTRLVAGFVHLRHSPPLRRITAASVVALLVLGFYESLTFAVLDTLDRPASFFGVLMSVQAAGSIAGGLVVARLVGRIGEARVLGVGLLAWTVASLVYTVASVLAAFAAVFVFGVAVTLHAVARATAVQRHTPPRVVGRAVAGVSMVGNAAQTISIGVGAVLVDRVDHRLLLLVVAVVVAAAASPLAFRKR